MAEKKKKKAMKRSLVDPNGQKKTVYIDVDTYQFIPEGLLANYDVLNSDSQVVEQVDSVDKPRTVEGIFLQQSDPTFEAISKSIASRNPLGPQPASRPTQSIAPEPTTEPVQTEAAPSATDVYDKNGIPTVDPDSGFAPAPVAQGPTSQLPELSLDRFTPPSRFDASKDFPQKDEPVSARSNPVGTATAETAKTNASGGFAALTKNTDTPAPRASLSFYHANQEAGVKDKLSTALSVAGGAIGKENIGITSGYRSPEYNNKVSNTGKTGYHTKGYAGDVDMSGWTEDERSQFVSEMTQLGAGGFITYSKYPDMMHVDMRSKPTGSPHFMHNESARNMKSAPGWFQGMAGKAGLNLPENPPVPYGRTENVPATNLNPEKTKDDVQMDSVSVANSEIAPQETQTAKAMESAKTAPTTRGGFVPGRTAFDMATATPAQFAAYGYTTRTPEEKSYIYETLAGELGQTSLKGLLAGDKAAKQELANMLATIENRAASKNFAGKSLEKSVLAGDQYNARSPSKMDTTKNNYSIYGETISKLGEDFYSGKLEPTAWDVDMFHASNMEKYPGWSASLIGAVDVGQHRFGENPKNYTPTADFYNERSKWEGVQTSETRGFNPGKGEGFANYSGPNTASGSRSDTPSEGGSRFGGGGLGTPNTAARDSPSESGSKFGGGGLGTPEKSGGYDSVGTPENNNDRGGPR